MRQQVASHKPFGLISRQECSIIAGLAEGYTDKQIGEKIGVSETAVQQNLRNLMRKRGGAAFV